MRTARKAGGRGRAWALGLLVLVSGSALARSGNYLIITASDYAGSEPLNEFVAHRTAEGFTVSTYVAAAGTTRESIKAYISSLWGTPASPKYLLIIGDTDGASATAATIPHWVGGGSKHASTDLPYACMGVGDDWLPDMCVGRFSVRTVAGLQAVVDKTICLESGSFPDPGFLHVAAFLATDDSSAQAEQTHENVISNYLEPGGFTPIRIYAAQGGDTQDIADAVNQGCLFVNYFGHSGSSCWSSPMFLQNNVTALMNEGLYGLVFGFSCNTANYPTAECFGETWLRAANRGAAAYLSASTLIYYGGNEWESSRRLEKYFWQTLFADNIWEVGPAWQGGLSRFYADPYFSLEIKRNMFEMFVLLGDPALNLQPEPGPQPSILLQSPNGGELLVSGQTHEVTWVAHDDVGVTAVDLFLSRDGGATWPVTIATGLPNTGLYSWTVPSGPTAHARVRAVAHDLDGNTDEDVSNGEFVIAPTAPVVVYDFPLDASPGWMISGGQWAFGQSLGLGGTQHGEPDPLGGHTGTNVFGVNLHGDYSTTVGGPWWLRSTALDLRGYGATSVRYWRWLNSDMAPFVTSMVQVSGNGTTWTELWTNGGTEYTESTWSLQEHPLGSVADDQPTVYVRWGYQVGSSAWPYSGWNIDDVQILGIPLLLPGDMNCDGTVDFGDINPFVQALTDPTGWQAQHPGCYLLNGDVNGSGELGFDDINPFVACLTSGGCP